MLVPLSQRLAALLIALLLLWLSPVNKLALLLLLPAGALAKLLSVSTASSAAAAAAVATIRNSASVKL
jgi:hypothetical protein